MRAARGASRARRSSRCCSNMSGLAAGDGFLVCLAIPLPPLDTPLPFGYDAPLLPLVVIIAGGGTGLV